MYTSARYAKYQYWAFIEFQLLVNLELRSSEVVWLPVFVNKRLIIKTTTQESTTYLVLIQDKKSEYCLNTYLNKHIAVTILTYLRPNLNRLIQRGTYRCKVIPTMLNVYYLQLTLCDITRNVEEWFNISSLF